MLKNSYIYIFIVYLILRMQAGAFAQVGTSVDISGNGSGSRASVNVQNSSQTNTQNQSSSSVHTDIRINTNGNIKTYSSDQPGEINIQSDDGTAKVHVNNNVNSSFNVQEQNVDEKINQINEEKDKLKEIFSTPSAKIEEKKEMAEQRRKEIENKKLNIIQFAESEFSSLKNFLNRLLGR